MGKGGRDKQLAPSPFLRNLIADAEARTRRASVRAFARGATIGRLCLKKRTIERVPMIGCSRLREFGSCPSPAGTGTVLVSEGNVVYHTGPMRSDRKQGRGSPMHRSRLCILAGIVILASCGNCRSRRNISGHQPLGEPWCRKRRYDRLDNAPRRTARML